MFQKKTEKYITFTIQIEKEITKTDKNGDEITKKYNLYIYTYYQILELIRSA